MSLLQRHAPPPFPAPASLPAPLLCATRRVATSGAAVVKWRDAWRCSRGEGSPCLLQRHAPPPFPAPASLPAPLFCATRRVATSGWGIASHAGATRRRNEWLSTKGRISSRFRSPSTPSVGSSTSKQTGGWGVCRCAAFCPSACCLLCYAAPPLPLPAPPMKGKAHPIALLCLLHQSTASAGSAVRFACELPVPASSINRK
jgi:hypothetical protein